MHEVGLCEDVVRAVERRAAGRRVEAIGLRIGAAHRVVEEAFHQAFLLVSPGTTAEGASVEIVTVPLSAHCRDCDEDFTADSTSPVCRLCASIAVDVRDGDELTLEWLRYRPREPGQEED